MPILKVAKLEPDAILPTRKHSTDAGIDLYSYDTIVIPPYGIKVVGTAITVEIPEGCCGQVWPKSRNNHLIGGGIVDEGYQGEILVKVTNTGGDLLAIAKGDPIAQLILVKITTPPIEEVSLEEIHAAKSKRGNTGGIVEQFKPLYVPISDFLDEWGTPIPEYPSSFDEGDR